MRLWAWQSVVPLSPLWTFKSPFLSELWGCVLWQNVRQLNSHGSLSWRWARSSRLLYRQQKKWTQALPAHPLHILWLTTLAVNPDMKFLSKDTLNYCQLSQVWAVSLSRVIILCQNVNEDSVWENKDPLTGNPVMSLQQDEHINGCHTNDGTRQLLDETDAFIS